jgi:hypothetical protein
VQVAVTSLNKILLQEAVAKHCALQAARLVPYILLVEYFLRVLVPGAK